MHSIQFYLTINEKSYDTDVKKVAFTLSYMTKGSALTWANTFWENAITGATITLGTWDNFLRKFQITFKHQDTTGNTISWLSSITWSRKMGSSPCPLRVTSQPSKVTPPTPESQTTTCTLASLLLESPPHSWSESCPLTQSQIKLTTGTPKWLTSKTSGIVQNRSPNEAEGQPRLSSPFPLLPEQPRTWMPWT